MVKTSGTVPGLAEAAIGEADTVSLGELRRCGLVATLGH